MRPIIILLVVIYHAFAMYAGVWVAPENLQQIPFYLGICKFAGGFHIEGMAFIAGYVYAFQSLSLGKNQPLGSFTLKKAKRLFVPSIFWGILYYFLFLYNADTFHPITFTIQLFSGVAHLWFLPMLFWCFVLLWLIEHFRISSRWLLIFLAVLSIMPTVNIPLGLSTISHFIFYCYLGYWLYSNYSVYTSKFSNCTTTLLLWGLFAIFCILDIFIFHSAFTIFSVDSSLFIKLSKHLLQGILKLGCAGCGILALYNTITLILPRLSNETKIHWAKVSDISFGVYLCHQFILIGLYRHTQLLELVGSYLFPWIGLFMALSCSIVITYYGIKNKPGAFLLK